MAPSLASTKMPAEPDSRGMLLRGVDENSRPDANGPNDEDRERFGFTKRKSQAVRQSLVGTGCSPRHYPWPDVSHPQLKEQPAGRGCSPRCSPQPDAAHAVPMDHPILTMPLSVWDDNLDATAPVALMPLIDSTLGDLESKTHLLRTKSAAPRYDF